jgi:hypothetical protein
MLESLKVFEYICRCPYFAHTDILLFLNKRDIFEREIVRTDLTCIFPDYEGGCNYDNALACIKDKFQQVFNAAPRPPGGHLASLYTHVTCATDTNQVKFVFAACQTVRRTPCRTRRRRVRLLRGGSRRGRGVVGSVSHVSLSCAVVVFSRARCSAGVLASSTSASSPSSLSSAVQIMIRASLANSGMGQF